MATIPDGSKPSQVTALSPGARAVFDELRLKATHIIDCTRPYELLIRPREIATTEFLGRVRPHVREIVRFLRAGGTWR